MRNNTIKAETIYCNSFRQKGPSQYPGLATWILYWDLPLQMVTDEKVKETHTSVRLCKTSAQT